MSGPKKRFLRLTYWLTSALVYVFMAVVFMGLTRDISRPFIVTLSGISFCAFLSKMIMIAPLLLEDVVRLFRLTFRLIRRINRPKKKVTVSGMGRKEFISKLSVGIGSVALFNFGYGIARGAYNYKIHRVKVGLKNLPSSFDGMRIAQISDIHSGSFWNESEVRRGVQMLIDERADAVFFTGDLVNDLATEAVPYMSSFGKISAPMGVYSVLGNHDYGDYYQWPDKSDKEKIEQMDSGLFVRSPMQIANLEQLKTYQKEMGWDLLMNEHRVIERNGEKIAVLGIENFGARGRFPKYGKLSEAYKGTEEYPVKLLLSHDPSHWNYEVTSKYTDIDMTFAGHTHGAQIGIEAAWLNWSPIQYMYKQWAGLYSENSQKLYVNRGFGFLGYPGRIGIWPEITIIELHRA
jgi:predicted MPP superfamily phosphohydrolase